MHLFWQMLRDRLTGLVPQLSAEQLRGAVHAALEQGDMVGHRCCLVASVRSWPAFLRTCSSENMCYAGCRCSAWPLTTF